MIRYRTDMERCGMEQDVDGEYVEYEEVVELVLFAMNHANEMEGIEKKYTRDEVEEVIDDFNN